jgi:hypothetical protein
MFTKIIITNRASAYRRMPGRFRESVPAQNFGPPSPKLLSGEMENAIYSHQDFYDINKKLLKMESKALAVV